MPDVVPGPRDIEVNKTGNIPTLRELTWLKEKQAAMPKQGDV